MDDSQIGCQDATSSGGSQDEACTESQPEYARSMLNHLTMPLVSSDRARSSCPVAVGDLFHSWDSNGDGIIDREEWHAAIQSLGVIEPMQVLDIVFNEFDEDLSGAIDYEECALHLPIVQFRSRKQHDHNAVSSLSQVHAQNAS